MGISNDPQTRVLIVGAGIAGLTMGTALRRQLLGFDNFAIYEKANQVGGTWRDNMYPGCGSDIAIHFYSLSTDLNPDWDSNYGSQPQIQSYWKNISEKYDLDRHIIFNTVVCSAIWSPEEELYDIVTEDLITGERSTTKVKVLITALGILEVPRIPDIPGIEKFKGSMFHAGRYDSSAELSGRRVAVIGNGASATQMIPMISADSTVQIVEFCRTPNWFIAPLRRKFTQSEKWIFRFIPFYMRMYRFACFIVCEAAYLSIFPSRHLRGIMEQKSAKYIRMTAPKECIEKLIPSYQMGCRRVIFDSDYLSALHRPNLKLCWDDIDMIVDDGIVTKQGEHFPFDTLIFATGYVTDDFPLHVKGVAMTVKEYYDSHNGPKAYLGTSVPGFPNLCIIGGPNTATGHISVVFTEEVQINYIIQLIRPILASRLSTFDVTHDATDAYNARIHAMLEKGVWATCFSWYRKGRVGKITSIFPGTGTLFWWWLRKVDWSHYEVSGSGNKKNEAVRGNCNWVLRNLVATTAIAVMWYSIITHGR